MVKIFTENVFHIAASCDNIIFLLSAFIYFVNYLHIVNGYSCIRC